MARLLSRLRSCRPADDLARLLPRALATWPSGPDLPPAQPIGCRMGHVTYERWRTVQLGAAPGLALPEAHPDYWPLVLAVVKPANVGDYLRSGRVRDALSTPTVGQFPPGVEPRDALAAALAGWIAGYDGGPHRLAPPILQDGLRAQVVTFGLTWPLPAAEWIERPAAA